MSIVLAPVIELGLDRVIAPWPVPPADDARWLELSGRLAPDQVGLAMAVIAKYHHRGDGDWPAEAGSRTALRHLVEPPGGDDDLLMVPGGLRLTDRRTGVTIDPGCCCGLEDWRDWLDVPDGATPWLGHSPTPWIEHHDDGSIRICCDRAVGSPAPAGRVSIELSRGDLVGLLTTVQRDLLGFIVELRRWADAVIPGEAEALAAAVDAGLSVSRPDGRR